MRIAALDASRYNRYYFRRYGALCVGENAMKAIPFEVRRDDGRPLVRQVVDGMRQAMVCGYYAPGDALPSYSDLAKALGVSPIVTKTAFRRLVDEGFVVARPRVGTFVRDRAAKRWLGHVVFVGFTEDGNFYQALFAATLRTKLMDAGYLFTEASLRWNARNVPDFSVLDAVLSRSVDLVIARSSDRRLFRHLAKFNVPFITIDGEGEPLPGSVGFTHFDRTLAIDPFVSSCLRLGIREVVSFTWIHGVCDVVPACLKAGLAARRVRVPLPKHLPTTRQEALARAGMESVAKKIAEGEIAAAPDRAYFFVDDHITSGALLAFALVGLEAPRDIRIATWANAGIVPAYPHELSRMEMDPVAAGRQEADYVLEYLHTGTYPSGGVIGPKWIQGETMGRSVTSDE